VKFQKTPVFGFTTRSLSKTNVLKNEISVSEAFEPKSGMPMPERKQFICIWDTGATGTVIRKRIADELGLQPSGRVIVHVVGKDEIASEYETNTYLVNLYLPNQVAVMGVSVSEGAIDGCDVLIGMDIIGIGDFALTNCNNRTCWSFRLPSVEEIDFVKEIREHNVMYKGRIASMKRKQSKRGK